MAFNFNPNEHLMQLQGKDYLEVKWRLVWFRDKFPNGSIETEMLLLDLDRETEEEMMVWNNDTRRKEKVIKRANGFAVFKAIVKDGQGGVGTGTKSEKAASFPDYIEKAESGSIGRALAALGFGTQFTGDELNEHHRIVDSPVDRGKSVQPQVKPSEVEECKSYVGKVFSFKQENYEARWGGYKVHVLNHAVADPDLTPADLAQLREYAKENDKKQAASVSGK